MNGYNFTDQVRYSLQAARNEAGQLHHEYIGTEHLLLGLLRPESGIAFAVLTSLDLDTDALRHGVMALLKPGAAGANLGPDLPYTSRAKKVLEEAMAEARALKHQYVGTEHLLLGLLREGKGVAAQVLVAAGTNQERLRAETLRLLREGPSQHAQTSPQPDRPTAVTILSEYDDGRLGAKKCHSLQEAIAYLTQLMGAP
jgi:ATP-dependent Clp protease ATP-binding subunit ClpC